MRYTTELREGKQKISSEPRWVSTVPGTEVNRSVPLDSDSRIESALSSVRPPPSRSCHDDKTPSRVGLEPNPAYMCAGSPRSASTPSSARAFCAAFASNLPSRASFDSVAPTMTPHLPRNAAADARDCRCAQSHPSPATPAASSATEKADPAPPSYSPSPR